MSFLEKFIPGTNESGPSRHKLHPEAITDHMNALASLADRVNVFYLQLATKAPEHDSGDTHYNFDAVTDDNRQSKLNDWRTLSAEISNLSLEWKELRPILEPLRPQPNENITTELALKIDASFKSLTRLNDTVEKINVWAKETEKMLKEEERRNNTSPQSEAA